MWLLIVAVGFMATAFGVAGNVMLGEQARDFQVVADQALTNGEGLLLSTLESEQQAGQAYSVPTTQRVGACSQGQTCTFFVQVSYQVQGATNAGAPATNEKSAELQQQAKIAEQLVGVHEVASVTSAQGAVLSSRSRRLTVRVSKVDAQIVARFDDTASSVTAIAGQGVGGCDSSSANAYVGTCNTDAQQAGSDTSSHVYLNCVDNPVMYAYCNSATPRPADQFTQPTWQNNDASGNGFAR